MESAYLSRAGWSSFDERIRLGTEWSLSKLMFTPTAGRVRGLVRNDTIAVGSELQGIHFCDNSIRAGHRLAEANGDLTETVYPSREVARRRHKEDAMSGNGPPATELRWAMKLAGSLLVGGALVGLIAGSFHAGTANPNDHAAVFKEYAGSDVWTAVHIALFGSGLLIVAGLAVLCLALARSDSGRTLACLVGVGAVLIAAASGLVLAVDGVALKQAVDAWVSAAPTGSAFAFQDAETIRWLEWGANSFLALVEGGTFVLLGLLVWRSVIASKWLGWTSLIAGVGYLAVGAIVGYEGFSDTVSAIGVTAGLLFTIFSIGLAVKGWRGNRAQPVVR